MPPRRPIIRQLAAAFAAGPMDVESLIERGVRILGKRWRWLRPLARRMEAAFQSSARPRRAEVEQFLHRDEGFRRALVKHGATMSAAMPSHAEMFAATPFGRSLQLPELTSQRDLTVWLGVSQGKLDWLADRFGRERKSACPAARRYRYRLLSKGRKRFRLIEAPKRRLKEVQRELLRGILDRIPPHESAHGFRCNRSILSFVAPHVGQRVLLKMDLGDFFPSIPVSRIAALFRTVGYPEAVADVLAGLCTNRVPDDVWETEESLGDPPLAPRVRWMYERPHLPQGAPTSPALANLCAYRLDARLAGLAQAAGCTYTRYADDLAFSGGDDFRRRAKRFATHVAAIVMEEGFRVNFRKTRIMAASARQHLAGLVVNQRANVARSEFDQLKATLCNCVRRGPHSQNRRNHPHFKEHLAGRIAFIEVVRPDRGERLRAMFDRIEW